MVDERKGERTRAHLVEVATAVFAEKGYAAARLADLVAASGLTKGAFYFHFPSKEAAAAAVLEATQESWLRVLRDRLATDPSPSALVDTVLELAEREPSSWAAFRLCADLHGVPHLTGRIRRHNQAWVDLLVDVLDRAVPGAAPDRVRARAVGLVGAVTGVHDIVTGLAEPELFRPVLAALVEGAVATLTPIPTEEKQ